MKKMIEYEIFLPKRDEQGHEYSTDLLTETRNELISAFGGMTDFKQHCEGFWKTDRSNNQTSKQSSKQTNKQSNSKSTQQSTIKDEIVCWRTLSDKGEAGDNIISDIKIKLEKLLKQDEILVIRRDVTVF